MPLHPVGKVLPKGSIAGVVSIPGLLWTKMIFYLEVFPLCLKATRGPIESGPQAITGCQSRHTMADSRGPPYKSRSTRTLTPLSSFSNNRTEG